MWVKSLDAAVQKRALKRAQAAEERKKRMDASVSEHEQLKAALSGNTDPADKIKEVQ